MRRFIGQASIVAVSGEVQGGSYGGIHMGEFLWGNSERHLQVKALLMSNSAAPSAASDNWEDVHRGTFQPFMSITMAAFLSAEVFSSLLARLWSFLDIHVITPSRQGNGA